MKLIIFWNLKLSPLSIHNMRLNNDHGWPVAISLVGKATALCGNKDGIDFLPNDYHHHNQWVVEMNNRNKDSKSNHARKCISFWTVGSSLLMQFIMPTSTYFSSPSHTDPSPCYYCFHRHSDLFVCPNGRNSTKACFDSNSITFVRDKLHSAPVG